MVDEAGAAGLGFEAQWCEGPEVCADPAWRRHSR